MDVIIEQGWKQILAKEFEAAYFKDLSLFVEKEYAQHQCYPPLSQVFAAFNQIPNEAVSVVIIGQDPYHGPNQANGLCFSVSDGVSLPPSLQNIYKELEANLQKKPPKSGNLEHWAQQGVLLLNATLTVRAHEAGSHQKQGWEQFTDAAIDTLSKEKENIVFLLWGGYAKKKGAKIDRNKHLVLSSGHPSPLSANRRYWFGNQHFSETNTYLVQHNKKPIIW